MRDKRMEGNMNAWRKETMACLETMEERPVIEGATEDMEPQTEYQEKMDAWIADMNDGRKERTACQEAMEANPEKTEPNPEMMQSVGSIKRSPRKKPQ
jgi:hypothetical protein